MANNLSVSMVCEEEAEMTQLMKQRLTINIIINKS